MNHNYTTMEWFGLHVQKPRTVEVDTPLTAMAFFMGSPRQWSFKAWPDKIVKEFKESWDVCTNLGPTQIIPHAAYLINLASKTPETRSKSRMRLLQELTQCDVLGLPGMVLHPGVSAKNKTQEGLQRLVDGLTEALSKTKHASIFIENMTGTNKLCQSWQEVSWVVDHMQSDRIGCCLDTAHCWGAGKKYGMCMETLLDDYDRIVGMDHLKIIHMNDSKADYGGNRDLHEDIGKGKIPKSFWNSFIFDARAKRIPTILETPSNCHPVVQKIIATKNTLEKSFDDSVHPKLITEYCEVEPEEQEVVTEPKTEEEETEVLESKEKQITVTLANPYENIEKLLEPSWYEALKPEFQKPYFLRLKQYLQEEYVDHQKIFPPVNMIFNAFQQCPLDKVKVVVWGQDPFHDDNQAMGLCFSVQKGIRVPSSLRNIYKELGTDLPDFVKPSHGDLSPWAAQGILMLNTCLTVRAHQANSHKDFGWQEFTDAVVKILNFKKKKLVFLLWGAQAKKKCKTINPARHKILACAHPSGLSANRGFFGCKHFSKCNTYLKSKGIKEIDWQIPE